MGAWARRLTRLTGYLSILRYASTPSPSTLLGQIEQYIGRFRRVRGKQTGVGSTPDRTRDGRTLLPQQDRAVIFDTTWN